MDFLLKDILEARCRKLCKRLREICKKGMTYGMYIGFKEMVKRMALEECNSFENLHGQNVVRAMFTVLRTNKLNLDYLEKGRLTCSPCSPIALPLNSPDTPELVKIVLLGAPGVGKTSIIQQFVWQNFVEEYSPTDCRHTYYPTVIVNNRLYELKITDLPALPYFPVNSVYELAECQCGLRDASAYMMVLDVSALDSFQYLETVREQIAESRDISTVPFLVVGNKIDLFDSEDDECLVQRRAIMDRVKGLWGCGYAECSARYSSLVCQVFRQLIISMNQDQNGPNACPSLFHDTLGAAKCSVL